MENNEKEEKEEGFCFLRAQGVGSISREDIKYERTWYIYCGLMIVELGEWTEANYMFYGCPAFKEIDAFNDKAYIFFFYIKEFLNFFHS